jgi:cysteine-rich repeat protein
MSEIGQPGRFRRGLNGARRAALPGIAVWLALCAGCDSATPADPCSGVSCSSRGFCIQAAGRAYCGCLTGYHPVALACLENDPADPCRGVDCSEHGTCRAVAGQPVCDCEPGFENPVTADPRCTELACELLCVAHSTTDGGGDADADGDGDGDADADGDGDAPADAEAEAEASEDVPASCGNGSLEPPEECDDGNPVDGDGCDWNCRFSCHEAADCADSDPCTADDCRAGGTGRVCDHAVAAGSACEDGDPCTDGDQCDDAGVCQGGWSVCACATTADCPDDGDRCNGTLICVAPDCVVEPGSVVVCTDPPGDCFQPVCDPATGSCEDEPLVDGTPCDDGAFCTADDRCSAGVCQGGGDTCPAGGCSAGCDETADRCLAAGSGFECRAAPGTCDVAEQCDGVSPSCPLDVLQPSGWRCRRSFGACDEAEYCTGDSPDCPADGFVADGTACDDGLGCSTHSACSGGSCVAYEVCDGADNDCDTIPDQGVSCVTNDGTPVCPGGAGEYRESCAPPTCRTCTCQAGAPPYWADCVGSCHFCPD